MWLQVLHSHMNKEIESAHSTFTVFDLLRTPGMRRISICLMAVWSDIHLLICSPVSPAYSFTCLPIYLLFCLLASSICFIFLFNKMKLLYPPVNLCTHLCAGSLLVLHTMAWRWTSRSLGWATWYLSSYLPAEVSVHLFKLLLPSYWLDIPCFLPIGCLLLQVSIYLMQIIFGAVDIPAKLFALGILSYLGRRVSQAVCLFFSAAIIFANIFVPTGTT